DICIFDVMMPEKDGFTLASDIRSISPDTPIIFLTAKNLKDDIIEGFRNGCDDYITKPFSMEELLCRMEAILRRIRAKKQAEKAVYKLGKYIFDSQKQQLVFEEDGEITKLTTKEADLMNLLCTNLNDILERNYTLKTIWIDDNYYNARSMDVYITKLRKLLRRDPQVQIINIHGKGYKLVAPSEPKM
ncbi:MAG: response regulator transcription factor, partial [Paludibacteraceae bacterium]|nr:response regulator transcription factor [Paludibacteraceae bacterium]